MSTCGGASSSWIASQIDASSLGMQLLQSLCFTFTVRRSRLRLQHVDTDAVQGKPKPVGEVNGPNQPVAYHDAVLSVQLLPSLPSQPLMIDYWGAAAQLYHCVMSCYLVSLPAHRSLGLPQQSHDKGQRGGQEEGQVHSQLVLRREAELRQDAVVEECRLRRLCKTSAACCVALLKKPTICASITLPQDLVV